MQDARYLYARSVVASSPIHITHQLCHASMARQWALCGRLQSSKIGCLGG